MKKLLATILLIASTAVHAQWGGFLDPNIMRQAGEAAATGNIQLNNIDMNNNGGRSWGEQAPTAAEVAVEMRGQEKRERAQAEASAKFQREQRVRAHIERMYVNEFGR